MGSDSDEGGESSGSNVLEVLDSDEEELVNAHHTLMQDGLIDLTDDI
jgi:hypothetical protein